MGKTALITTYHRSLSYGGCLQAYATYLLLSDRGYDARFVDCENPYEARRKSLVETLRRGTLKEACAALVKAALFKSRSCTKRAFGGFPDTIPLTERRYSSVDQMRELSADVFVVGSDQVWNPDITQGYEPVFLLDFGSAGKRISLASSMGSHEVPEAEKEMLAKTIGAFDAVSVREEFARRELADCVPSDIEVLLDPTMLISGSRWQEYAKPVAGLERGGYILLFMVANGRGCYEPVIDRVKRTLGSPVVQVRLNAQKLPFVDELIAATPQEFVWLIDNAALVVTDSFHGIAFSLNMGTPFVFVPNPSNNVRLQELVDSFGVSAREFELVDAQDKDALLREHGPDAEQMLNERRCDGLAWVDEALA